MAMVKGYKGCAGVEEKKLVRSFAGLAQRECLEHFSADVRDWEAVGVTMGP